MFRKVYFVLLGLLLLTLPAPASALSDRLLVDFGADAGSNVFNDIPSLPGTTYKSWKASRYGKLIAFYDPDDLADVLSGAKEPYAALDVRPYLIDPESGLAAMAADRDNGYLYMFEKTAEGSRAVIHVFKVGEFEALNVTPTFQAIDPGAVASYQLQVQTRTSFSETLALSYTNPAPGFLEIAIAPTAVLSTQLATLTNQIRLLVGGARVYLPLVMRGQ